METINQTFNRIVEQTKATTTGTGGQYSSLCPAHNDRSPSLSLTLTEDRILIKCHSGCSIKEVCSGLGIKESDFIKNVDPIQKPKGPLINRKITFRLIQRGKFTLFQASTKNR